MAEFHDLAAIERLADEIQAEHALRLGGPTQIPMVPRPFMPRPRPQTAIISRAAQSKIDMSVVLSNTLNRWGVSAKT